MMGEYLAYPRLPEGEALALHKEIVETASINPSALQERVSTSHPRAMPVPTGARVATEDEISEVRWNVTNDLDRWLTGQPIPRNETPSFDRALGASLYEHLRILPADAGHVGTWSFLTAVVFPDIAWARFPELHIDRVLGKRHRNTLRRAWHRHAVIGDIQANARHPLGEDEMTGLFERSTLAMNAPLIRLLTRMILESDTPSRSDYARRLTKRTIALTGPYLLDGLDDDELRRLIDPTAERAVTGRPVTASEELPTTEIRRHDSNDLVREFHQEMVQLCERIEVETGYRPSSLQQMVSQSGGLEAARVLVSGPHRSDVFVQLSRHKRLDLSVERLILRDEFRGLFSGHILDQAGDRLNAAGQAAV